MPRQRRREIDIKNEKDLKKLNINVYLDRVVYESESRKISADMIIEMSFPDTQYRYSGSVIVGDALAMEQLNFSLKEANEVEEIKKRITEQAEKELWKIKTEIRDLLEYTPKVAIDLSGMLARILKSVSTG